MTGFNFAPNKTLSAQQIRASTDANTLATSKRARRIGLVSSSARITSPPPEDRSRYWQQANSSASLTLKQALTGPRALRDVSLRVPSLGGH